MNPLESHTGGGLAPADLSDVLERILDKGLVIAGDISIRLVDIELLTIKVRLLLASMDRAAEMGIDWWRYDPFLSGKLAQPDKVPSLDERLTRLENLLQADATQKTND